MAGTVGVYRRLLREAAGVDDLRARGAAVLARLERDAPELVDELEGIAAGAGQDAGELAAINARTELLGGAECSVLGRVDGDRVRLTQTWDWHPALAPSRVVWTVCWDGGWLTTVTEAGILAKLGLNGAGIACGLNFLESSLDGGVPGMPIHVLLRLALQRCERLTDALALLLQAPVSASSSITLAAREKDGTALVCVELSPAGPAVVWPDANGMLAHTNHFLAPERAAIDTQPAGAPGTLLRRRRLLEDAAAGLDVRATLATHFPAGEPLCRHADPAAPWPDRRATLLAVDIDPGRPSLAVAAGAPCDAPFEPVLLPI